MSYVTTPHTMRAIAAPASAARPATRQARARRPSAAGIVAATLEAGLLLFILSGISLVLCTIAAGAI